MEESWKTASEKQILIEDSNVSDWLLTEILQRLPLKRIFMSKCVSKRWHSLISDPFFARLYITRINNSSSLSTSRPWNLLFRYLYEVRIVPSSMIGTRIALKQSHDFSSPGFSLNFMPSSRHDCPMKILASSNGLLLCSESFYWQKIYYICNPLIQQWIGLPKPPRVIKSVAIGFISKDDCYKLVRFPTADDGSYPFYAVQLETFSSKAGEWHCSMVNCPLFDYYIKTDSLVVNYNGILHWLEFRHRKIITFDPENETDVRLDFMNLPDNKQSDHLCLLGVTRGRFRYFEVTDTCLGARYVCVWEVSDYDARQWCLEYRVKFSDSWSGEVDLFIPKDKFYVFPLALHPLNSDVVYLGYGSFLVSYNLTTRKMEVVHRNFYSHQLLPFVLSPWPTTIPPPFW
ncbi:Detected protein of unknown function [Hibiscus syriacus]|uniref:Uncharacterized protein n=1 Tax=Hibiscus syriacus TaxID=106335 RepID=A0A6A2ZJI3_HIBSY|nr:F-box protein At3g26010-like [Hibiscus syriacus]KAE8691726.1 Detected protein of unknown function [Hibiscus syriacus]